MPEGWIKLHRKLLDWEWFQDGEMVHLFIYFLLKANYEDKKWKGVDVRRGQLVTGLYKIKNDTGLSIQKIRTCIRRMETEKNPKINKQSNNQYTIITVCNYDSYQGNGINVTNEITNEQQTNNKPITTTKEEKEEIRKENKKSNNASNKKIPTYEEFKEYALNKKNNVDQSKLKAKYESWIENGWKDGYDNEIKNWKAKLINVVAYIPEGEKPKPPKILKKR